MPKRWRHRSTPTADRWLALFKETARELCDAPAADHFIERAGRIAESLELAIAGRHGVLLEKRERFQGALVDPRADGETP